MPTIWISDNMKSIDCTPEVWAFSTEDLCYRAHYHPVETRIVQWTLETFDRGKKVYVVYNCSGAVALVTQNHKQAKALFKAFNESPQAQYADPELYEASYVA
jgi:hypothetical protein